MFFKCAKSERLGYTTFTLQIFFVAVFERNQYFIQEVNIKLTKSDSKDTFT